MSRDTRYRGRYRVKLVAASAALMLVAAACGDDDDDATPASTAAGATAAPGATTTAAATTVAPKSTIKIGVIGNSLANTGQTQPDEGKKVSEAWAAALNAAGGVNGYKVEIVFRDALNDSAKTLQALQEMDAAGVLSVTQLIATRLTASMQLIEGKQIPILGGTPYTPEFDTSPMFFQISSSYKAGVWGQVTAAKALGADHFRNVYCTEAPACAQAAPVTEEAAKAIGITHSAVSASARAASYTATCLDAKNAKVTFFQSNGLNTPNVIKDCKDQAFRPVYGVGGAANQATVDALQGEKYGGNLYEFGVFYNGPEVQKFRQTLARTDLKEADWGQTSVHTWLSLQMTEKVMAKMTAANPTRADFLTALRSIKDENLGGQIAPVDYTKQTGTGKFLQDCWTHHTIVNGKLTHMDDKGQPVTKLTFICGKVR